MMQNGAVQDVGTLIDKLAAKLAVPAAHLWDILVRQARAEAIFNGILAVVFVAALGVALHITIKGAKELKTGYDADEWAIPATIGGTIASIILVVLTLTALHDLVLYLVNPEYFAVEKILSALK